ncbi:hypothetical protein KEM48_013540 [Puccinia striiformis f. sp. tritici PST-130]|nr:hypothetical protein KEM48_013540 [Puccinia striiformis f. sp. tritici PST-130]
MMMTKHPSWMHYFKSGHSKNDYQAFGCGLRMDLNEISLSSLTNQSDIELDPIKTIEATRQKDFVLPD